MASGLLKGGSDPSAPQICLSDSISVFSRRPYMTLVLRDAVKRNIELDTLSQWNQSACRMGSRRRCRCTLRLETDLPS
jgi:hypothetical protein